MHGTITSHSQRLLESRFVFKCSRRIHAKLLTSVYGVTNLPDITEGMEDLRAPAMVNMELSKHPSDGKYLSLIGLTIDAPLVFGPFEIREERTLPL